MRKLKQSAALLLVVSFLLSIFSLSAIAAGDKVKVHIDPRLLSADKAEEYKSGEKSKYTGEKLQNPPGQQTGNLEYTLYKVGDLIHNKDEVEFNDGADIGADNSGYDNENKLTINDKEVTVYTKNNENPLKVKVGSNGEGTVEIEKEQFGWYYVVMEEDQLEGRTCSPMLICLNGDVREDFYAYPKVVDTERDVTIIKRINGLTLGDEKQSPHVRYGEYVMTFDIFKKVDGNWVKQNEGDLKTYDRIEKDKDPNEKYGTYKTKLTSGEYKICEKSFTVKGYESSLSSVFSAYANLFKGEEIDKKRFMSRFLLNDDIVNNMCEGQVETEFKIEGQPVEKDVFVDNKMKPQITKSIIGEDNKKYITKGVKQGEKIKYRLEVDKPFVTGNSADDIKKVLNKQYPVFEVHDEALVGNKLVKEVGNDNNLVVCFVDGNGNRQQLAANDYELKFDNGKKNITVDLTRNRRGFSDTVAQKICDTRGDNRAHFEIEFEVEVISGNDLSQYFNLNWKDIRVDHSDHDEVTYKDILEQKKFALDLLKIDNEAFIKLDKNIKIISNRVKTQFGVLTILKEDNKHNRLSGAIFELFDEKGNKVLDGTSNGNGAIDYIIPVGTDKEFIDEEDYLHHQGIAGRLAENSFLEWILDVVYVEEGAAEYNTRSYVLREKKAPDGFEKINCDIEINMNSCWLEKIVVNYPKLELPFTGGIGTIVFTVVGILLIGSGAFLFINSRRKKSAE